MAVWVFSALLILATLDTSPDPPAVNPGVTRTKVVFVSGIVFRPVPLCRETLASEASFGERFHPGSRPSAHPRPVERMVVTCYAANASPPLPAV